MPGTEPRSAVPTVSAEPTLTASASPASQLTLVACDLGPADGFYHPEGDHDCRGSAGPTPNPGPRLGSYHVTDKPDLGKPISFTIEVHNGGATATGPLTLVFVGDLTYLFPEQFPSSGCSPACRRGPVLSGMTGFEWAAGLKPGETKKLTAMYRSKAEGYWYYKAGLFKATLASVNEHFLDWAVGNTGPTVFEWDDVQSVVFSHS